MGIFDFLFGAKPEIIDDAGRLHAALWEAANAEDSKRLSNLVKNNADLIRKSFPDWQVVPEGIRENGAAVQAYGNGLIGVAQCFLTELGDSSLMEALQEPPGGNPLIEWQDALGKARGLIDECNYDEAIDLLENQLSAISGLSGSGVDSYLPITHGWLGEAYLQNGQPKEAIPHTEAALGLCRQTSDQEGVVAYLGNLFEIHRYLGNGEPAASCAIERAEELEKVGIREEAESFRRQAEIIRAGEPLLRVVLQAGERQYELAEAEDLTDDHIQFILLRNRMTLKRAELLTEQGSELASKGKHEEALPLFTRAAEADLYDPNSRYLAGLTLLYLQQYADAVEMYKKVEELAPGWYHCRTDLWIAQQLAVGRIPHEAFLAHVLLEYSPGPAKEKVRIGEQAVAKWPGIAPLHLQLGMAYQADGNGSAAIEQFEATLSCAEDKGIESRALVALAAAIDDEARKKELCGRAIELNGNLVATATAMVLLAHMDQ